MNKYLKEDYYIDRAALFIADFVKFGLLIPAAVLLTVFVIVKFFGSK